MTSQKTSNHEEMEEMEDQVVDCIEDCINCHSYCLQTIQHCLHIGGDHAQPDHIRLLMDCAQICQVSADFMMRSSDWDGLVCSVSADICDTCADDCERFREDEFMMECAEICRKCAKSCQEMASMRMDEQMENA